MTILDKLMEKKDLKTYIINRIKFLKQEKEHEVLRAPEQERGFLNERFIGRVMELEKLSDSLEKDLIKEYSKKYYRKTNTRK